MKLIITDPDTGEEVEQKTIDFDKYELVDTGRGIWEVRLEHHRSTRQKVKMATVYTVFGLGYLGLVSIENGWPPAITEVGYVILVITMIHLVGTIDQWWE